jgi:shikimate 5-dehydrogenase
MPTVVLIGSPVGHSLSPRMQNAAFAEAGLDWRYEALDVAAEKLESVVRGLNSGANVTTPYKQDVARILGSELPSVNTLVVRGGDVEAYSTDAAVLDGLEFERPAIVGDGGAAAAFRHRLPDAKVFSRRGEWPPRVDECDLVVHATPVRNEALFQLRSGQTLVDLPYPDSATAAAARAGGAGVLDGLEALVAQGAASFELWTGMPAPVEVMRRAVGLPRAEADDSG